MKKQIIFLFFLSIHLQSYCQPFTTTAPCTDSFLLSIKGKYRQYAHSSSGVSQAHNTEMKNRLNAVFKQLQEAYPQPAGIDVSWGFRTWGNIYFAVDADYNNGIPTYGYALTCLLHYYYCGEKSGAVTDVIQAGETGTQFHAFANGAQPSWDKPGHDANTMTVNGLPVLKRYPAREKWKGYELFHFPGGGASRSVMIHRKGILPYIPVTRKQYLDYCIQWLNIYYDQLIEWFKKVETEKSDGVIKGKTAMIRRYETELQKTTAANLLDSAAIIFDWIPGEEWPIFGTETEGAGMLITENPAYMRKDLPKYVPQIFWLRWSWSDGAPELNFSKMIETNFPIEKLQAMIDK